MYKNYILGKTDSSEILIEQILKHLKVMKDRKDIYENR